MAQRAPQDDTRTEVAYWCCSHVILVKKNVDPGKLVCPFCCELLIPPVIPDVLKR